MDSSTNEARIKISMVDGTFELAGSETFVTQQIENFRSIIDAILTTRSEAIPQSRSVSVPKVSEVEPEAVASNGSGEPKSIAEPIALGRPPSDFPNVIHVDADGTTNILLRSIPGSTTAKKAVNVAMMYLWGKRSAGVAEVPLAEIRSTCEAHNCLDTANFATTIKNAKESVILNGDKGSPNKMCKLAPRAMPTVEALLAQLNNAS